MKNLELNQMELHHGGTDPVACGVGILVGAATYGLLGGPLGLVAGLIVAGVGCLAT